MQSKTAELFAPTAIHQLTRLQIEKICSDAGVIFTDFEFPPSKKTLYASNKLDKDDHTDNDEDIVWKRPKDFSRSDSRSRYLVFEDSIEPNDIKQGALGDCWFMCALASIAEFPQMVRNLFLDITSDDANTYGIYTVQFCKNGSWVEVIIDDQFPCSRSGGPKYSRCHGHELWVLILEKAYAKLHGSYAAIESGLPFEAMMDLTGEPYKNFRFDDDDVRESISDGSLWEYLSHCHEKGYIMSCDTPGTDDYTKTGGKPPGGLVPGHAYTLIRCVTTKSGGYQLCKVRNPWGQHEWDGDWGDNSPLWTPALKRELNVTSADDGMFWISFTDLVRYFTSVNVCLSGESSWCESRHPIVYNFSREACGLISVPMFTLTVFNSNTHVFVTIHQRDERIVGSKKYIDTGVTVMQATAIPGEFVFVGSTGNCVDRQNQLELPDLSPGSYLVIPVSGSCKVEQLKQEWALQRGGARGSDAELDDICSRSAVLSIHTSDSAATVQEIPFDMHTYEEADELPAEHDGKRTNLVRDGSVQLLSKKAGYDGMSFVGKNSDPRNRLVGITMDFSRAVNIVSHRGDIATASRIEIVVPSGSDAVLHHIVPASYGDSWSASYSVENRWITGREADEWIANNESKKAADAAARRRELLAVVIPTPSSPPAPIPVLPKKPKKPTPNPAQTPTPTPNPTTVTPPSPPPPAPSPHTRPVGPDPVLPPVPPPEPKPSPSPSPPPNPSLTHILSTDDAVITEAQLHVDIEQVVPLCGACCFLCNYSVHSEDNLVNCSDAVDCDFLCFQADVQCLKPVYGHNNGSLESCLLSEGYIALSWPTVCLQGVLRCLGFDGRCALPCHHDVPCVLNLCGANLCIDFTCKPAICATIHSLREEVTDPFKLGSVYRLDTTAAAPARARYRTPRTRPPGNTHFVLPTSASASESYGVLAAPGETKGPGPACVHLIPLASLGALVPLCATGCSIISCHQPSEAEQALQPQAWAWGIVSQMLMTCCESDTACLQFVSASDSDPHSRCVLVEGWGTLVWPTKCFKGASRCCRVDSRCALPCDDDVPPLCSICGATFCINYTSKFAVGKPVGTLLES